MGWKSAKAGRSWEIGGLQGGPPRMFPLALSHVHHLQFVWGSPEREGRPRPDCRCLQLAWSLLWCFLWVKANNLAHDLQPQEVGLRPGSAFPAIQELTNDVPYQTTCAYPSFGLSFQEEVWTGTVMFGLHCAVIEEYPVIIWNHWKLK